MFRSVRRTSPDGGSGAGVWARELGYRQTTCGTTGGTGGTGSGDGRRETADRTPLRLHVDNRVGGYGTRRVPFWMVYHSTEETAGGLPGL